MKSLINVIIKVSLVILFVVVSTSYVHIIETKTFSDSINRGINLSTMALKAQEFVEKDIYLSRDTYTGDLTGYVFNCPLCNGTLGCMRSYNIKDGKTTYPDVTYGTVRIVASSSNLPCGTIIRFNSGRISEEPVFAIVLDRGVPGNDIDLLTKDLNEAYKVGRSAITYDVLRNGWGEQQ